MRNSVAFLVAAALVPITTSVASAQMNRTGATVIACPFSAGCDANWSVQWYGLNGGSAPGVTGALANAAIASSIPTPPWSPNIGGVQQWIGVSNDASVSTAHVGDGSSSYRYFFQTTTTNAASQMSFGMGWDNRLMGIFSGPLTINADGSYSGGTSVFDPTPYTGKSGFCRDADGVLAASAYPNCLVNVSLQNIPASSMLTFVVEGDGQTDGLLVGTSSVTPEPGSIVLLASGLIGMAAVVVRRRRAGAVAR